MFEKFLNKSVPANNASSQLEQQLILLEKQIDIAKRSAAVQQNLIEIQSNTPMNLDRVMEMIGTLGTDGTISQSIIDNMRNVLGNNPDPIQMTKYFSGLIAQRVLTIADVRKIPGELLAHRGGVPLDITSARVYAQPVHLFGASSLLQPVRFSQAPFSLAFDANGEATVGVNVYNNYTTTTVGTFGNPFVAHLFVLKRNDTLRGDSKFFIESEHGYKAGIQLTDDTAALLMLNHVPAIRVDATQGIAGAPPNADVTLTFNETHVSEEYELDTINPMDVNVRGTNVSITHYQLPMYTPLAEAVLAALISGRLDMLPKWMLNVLSSTFKF